MNRDSPFAKGPREDSQKTEEKCKAFNEICNYFSKEEWEKLGNSQKRTYVHMKRNYDTMTGLGVVTNLPVFMRPKTCTKKPPESNSDEDQNCRNHDEGPQEATNVQQREHVKVSPKSEGPQSLSLFMDVNMVMAKKPAWEENYFKPLLVKLGSKPAQKELHPLRKASAPGKKNKNKPGM